jgi:hypothetical protein
MSELERDAMPDERDALARLLRAAGLRPDVDAARHARVLGQVREVWNATRRRRRRRAFALAASFAAATLLAVGVLRHRSIDVPAPDVAVVIAVRGQVEARDARGSHPVSPGDRLRAGDALVTRAGSYVALSLATIASLRLDATSELTLDSAQRFALARGGAYVDSGGLAGGIELATPLLRARDVGTRFQVRHHAASGSTVAVRDGRVAVDADGVAAVDGGERLNLAPDGTHTLQPLPSHAREWDWVRQSAAPFAAQGRPLLDLIEWYALEAGLALQIEPDAALRARLAAPLHGDLDGLSPDELLDVARAAGDFRTRIDSDSGILHVQH